MVDSTIPVINYGWWFNKDTLDVYTQSREGKKLNYDNRRDDVLLRREQVITISTDTVTVEA